MSLHTSVQSAVCPVDPVDLCPWPLSQFWKCKQSRGRFVDYYGLHRVYENRDYSGQWCRCSWIQHLVCVGAWSSAFGVSCERRHTSRHARPGTCSRMLLVTIYAWWARLWPQDDHCRSQFRCRCCDAIRRTVASRWSCSGGCLFFRSRWWNWATERILFAAVGMGSYTSKLAVCHPVRLNRWSIFALARTEISSWCTWSRSTTVLQPWPLHWQHIPWTCDGRHGSAEALQACVNLSCSYAVSNSASFVPTIPEDLTMVFGRPGFITEYIPVKQSQEH